MCSSEENLTPDGKEVKYTNKREILEKHWHLWVEDVKHQALDDLEDDYD